MHTQYILAEKRIRALWISAYYGYVTDPLTTRSLTIQFRLTSANCAMYVNM